MFYYLLSKLRKTIQCSKNHTEENRTILFLSYLIYGGFTLVMDLAAYKKLLGAVETCLLFT